MAVDLFLLHLATTILAVSSTTTLGLSCHKKVCVGKYLCFKLFASGSVYLGTHMKDVGLGMLSKEHGFFAKQSAYQNMMYPLSRLAHGRNEPAGYGAANINERLEEDVGRLLAELRLGTTAVEMK